MKFTIAVPTYQRPRELEAFVSAHQNILSERNIHLAIFHNEKNPAYSPENSKYVKKYFNEVNIGTTGNSKKICNFFRDPNEYWLPLPDTDVINEYAIDQLILILNQTKFDCLKFDKGLPDSQSELKVTYFEDYLQWLSKVPISEVQFVYRGGSSNLVDKHLQKKYSGSAFWDRMPYHTYVLQKACMRQFTGVTTNINLVKPDLLGSVSSGWTTWIPNIIICHVTIMKFCIYGAINLSNSRESVTYRQVCSLISCWSPGLINHMRLSITHRMYSGRRINRLAVGIIQKYRDAFDGLDQELIQEFHSINSKPLFDLPIEWQIRYKELLKQRRIFAESYPDWIHCYAEE